MGQSKMDNLEKLATLDKKNIREYPRGNQKWAIQRNWQYRVHKTKKNKTKTQRNIRI